jgi:hypothetical protein
VQKQNEQKIGECFNKPQLYDVSSFIKDKTQMPPPINISKSSSNEQAM